MRHVAAKEGRQVVRRTCRRARRSTTPREREAQPKWKGPSNIPPLPDKISCPLPPAIRPWLGYGPGICLMTDGRGRPAIVFVRYHSHRRRDCDKKKTPRRWRQGERPPRPLPPGSGGALRCTLLSSPAWRLGERKPFGSGRLYHEQQQPKSPVPTPERGRTPVAVTSRNGPGGQ